MKAKAFDTRLFKRILKTNESDISNMKFTKNQFLQEFSNIDFKGK